MLHWSYMSHTENVRDHNQAITPPTEIQYTLDVQNLGRQV